MAKEAPAKPVTKPSQDHPKLPRLSGNQKIQKRPLLHPAIGPPRRGASTQKIVYISASSPFISIVKRVRKLLSHIESRATGPITFAARNERDILRQIDDGISGKGKGREEEVIMKATGKAIEKLLGLAIYFQGQDDVKVAVRTGSVGAVDDIVAKEDCEDEDVAGGSQVRRTSSLEVGILLR